MMKTYPFHINHHWLKQTNYYKFIGNRVKMTKTKIIERMKKMDTLKKWFILKIKFNYYGQQFHEYHQNNQIICQLKSLNIKKRQRGRHKNAEGLNRLIEYHFFFLKNWFSWFCPLVDNCCLRTKNTLCLAESMLGVISRWNEINAFKLLGVLQDRP